MKSREKIDTERFSKALAILRQEVDAVLKDAPNLMEINRLEEIPGEKSKFIEGQLWRILLYGEYYVEKVKSDLNVPLLTVKSRGKNYAFYENKYPAFIGKVRKLIGASSIPSTEAFERSFEEEFYLYDDYYGEFIWNDQTLNEYELYVKTRYVLNSVRRYNRVGWTDDPLLDGDEKIRNSFAVAVDAVEYTANCHRFIYNHFQVVIDATSDIPTVGLPKEIFDENTRKRLGFHRNCFDFDPPEPYPYEKIVKNCNLVAERFWFKPDTWLANERAISPVMVARDLEKIPEPVKSRIDEIYLSLVFGNWMSAIALSRCLLEYVLLEFLPRKKYRYDGGREEKTLWKLSSVVAEALSATNRNFDSAEWKANARRVIENGNVVMHPEPPKEFKNNVLKFDLANVNNEAKAKESFEAIRKIVSALSDAKFWKN